MFKEYPYINLTDLNLDYMYRMLKDMETRLSDYVKQSTITFHDPITWDITDQYTVNTMVVDTDGTAYLSVRPVPAGIDITDTDYWQPIFNYDDNINKLMSNITVNTRTTGVLPEARTAGSLAWFDGTLYMVNADLASGSVIQPGVNATAMTLEDWIELMRTALENADTALGGRIDQEILDRQAADTALGNADIALGGRIDQEILDRQAADTALGNADIALGGRIDQEILDRQAADTALNNRLAAVESIVGRSFILIGDSYGVGVDGDDNSRIVTGGGWIQRCANFIRNGGGTAYYNTRGSGLLPGVSGFASSLPFLTILQAIEADHITNNDSITDIIVFGGTNDVSYTNNVPDAIASFMTYCKEHFTHAKVKIGALGANIGNMIDVIAPVYRTCLNYGAEYVADLGALFFNLDYIGSDNVHLKETGYALYSPYVLEAILSGHTDYKFGFTCAMTSAPVCTVRATDPVIAFEYTAHNISIFMESANASDVFLPTNLPVGGALSIANLSRYPQSFPSMYKKFWSSRVIKNVSGGLSCPDNNGYIWINPAVPDVRIAMAGSNVPNALNCYIEFERTPCTLLI